MPQKIAIVDDEVDICLYLATILEDEGYEAVVIDYTKPIMERLLEEKPNLVILDIMMPGVSGLSLYKKLREHAAFTGVKLAILSGMLSSASKSELTALTGDPDFIPPDAFISKPVDIGQFLSTVHTLLS